MSDQDANALWVIERMGGSFLTRGQWTRSHISARLYEVGVNAGMFPPFPTWSLAPGSEARFEQALQQSYPLAQMLWVARRMRTIVDIQDPLRLKHLLTGQLVVIP